MYVCMSALTIEFKYEHYSSWQDGYGIECGFLFAIDSAKEVTRRLQGILIGYRSYFNFKLPYIHTYIHEYL